MGGVHQGLKLVQSTVTAVHLRLLLAFRIDGHQVEEVRSQGFDVVQTLLDFAKSAAVAIQFGIDLVNLPMVTCSGGQGKDFLGVIADDGKGFFPTAGTAGGNDFGFHGLATSTGSGQHNDRSKNGH